MKKNVIIIVLFAIFIPYLIVTLCIRDGQEHIALITNYHVRVKREKLNKIETIPLEEYVIGVVAGEMPARFPLEALKSQAVAARTYVLRKCKMNQEKEYDVSDSTNDQVFLDQDTMKKNWQKDYNKNYQKIKQAVVQTQGQYMTYKGEIVQAFYFSTSNGKTENSEEVFSSSLPYLKSVDSKWDEKVSPVYKDTEQFSLLDFYTKLGMQYQKTCSFKILDYNSSGSVKTIQINDKTFTGREMRTKLGLRSTYFTMKVANGNVFIDTKGFGHGVGMSQYGALGMAEEGNNYLEILEHYYQGIEIQKI